MDQHKEHLEAHRAFFEDEKVRLPARVAGLRRDLNTLRIVVFIGIGAQFVSSLITIALWLMR